MQGAVEALRGLAAALVVVAHYAPIAGVQAGWTRYTFTGVDLFFVLTGYVFASTWFRPQPPPGWAGYALRRVCRLMPLYALAVLAYAALNLVQGAGSEQGRLVALHLLFLHTLQTREIAFSLNPAFWSLPVEVAFYLVLPLLAAAHRRGLPWGLLLGGALLAQGLIAAAAREAGPAVTPAFVLSVHLPGLLGAFALGATAWRVAQRGLPRGVAAGLVGGGVVLWALAARVYGHTGSETGVVDAVVRGWPGLVAAVAMAAVMAGVGAWPDRATSSRWASQARGAALPLALWLGALSYGVYLFHNLMPRLLAPWQAALGPAFLPACALATVVLAWGLHRTVEAPARAWGRARARRLEAGVA